MDIHFLKSLIAVVDTGSIAKAARLQYLTAAAVSQRILTLERELNCELLSRSGRTAKPTVACLNLIPRARKLVREAELLKGDIDSSYLTGTIKIGAISTALTGIIPLVLKKLTIEAPKVTPHIIPGTSKSIYDALLLNDIDVAIVVEPPFPQPKSLSLKQIRQENLVLLSNKTCEKSIQEILLTEPYICYDSSSWGGRIAERYIADNGLSPKTLCELDALETICILVENKLGVSLVPNYSSLEVNNSRYTTKIIDDERYLRNIVIITNYPSQNPFIIEKFMDCLFS